MTTYLLSICAGTVLCTVGFVGWILEIAGWEQKKMALWEEGLPAEKSLLHRFGGWLIWPMAALALEANSIAPYENLGIMIVVSTALACFLLPYLLAKMS